MSKFLSIEDTSTEYGLILNPDHIVSVRKDLPMYPDDRKSYDTIITMVNGESYTVKESILTIEARINDKTTI